PAGLLGLPAAQGLAPGAPADVALFTKDAAGIRILRTYKRGQLKYDARDVSADRDPHDTGFTR
ncbi:hypothetical protein CPT76_32410, partial [Paenibacillus sp. AR247]